MNSFEPLKPFTEPAYKQFVFFIYCCMRREQFPKTREYVASKALDFALAHGLSHEMEFMQWLVDRFMQGVAPDDTK